MLTRARLFVLPLSLLACMAIAIPAASASAQTSAGAVPTPKKNLPEPRGRAPAIPLVTGVETLGATEFQRAYGGHETSSSGHLAVLYVVRGATQAAAFLSAVRDEATRSGQAEYEVAYVPHSFAQLEALTNSIALDGSRWQARGITLAEWGPDAATSKVVITLRSYTAAAARELLATYGASWVSVSRKSLKQHAYDADRYYDTAPFWGGDRIFDSNEANLCTDGFIMLGNDNPSNHWATTAGHCGSRTWYTNFTHDYRLGATSTNYWNSTNTDIQTIGPVYAVGIVWGNDGEDYVPYTSYTPGREQICFDGATPKNGTNNGNVCNVSVANPGPFCTTISGAYKCGLGRAYDSSRQICVGGDSGGPVFQRTSNDSYIKAVGSITGFADSGHTCYYTLLQTTDGVQNITNTHLDTNPSG
jgi:hypothetical protein